MNGNLFKLASCGLLALAWAWLTMTLIPQHVKECRGQSSDFAHMANLARIRGTPGIDWEYTGQTIVDLMPNRILAFMADNSGWVFVAGVLIAAWCYALTRMVNPRPFVAYLANVWRANRWHIGDVVDS